MPKTKQSLSLRGLRTFCVAASLRSFRLAGEALFITASAVSHQVKSLEQELGLKLFDRNSRELELTESGQALYEEVNPLIEQLDAVAGKFKSGKRRSSIRISVQPFFASEYFVPRLSEFTAQNPDIDIQVDTSDESSEHHPSGADLSIRLFKTPPENLESDLLFPLRMIPAGSPDFKSDTVVRKKQIVSDFPLIVHESRPKAWQQWADASGISLPAESKVTRLGSMIAVVRAAEQGIGAALVPVPIAEQWFKQGSIVRLFQKELVADLSYYLVSSDAAINDESSMKLKQWILKTLK